ncbi:hypothetical protein C1N72_14395 [Pantoea ananatis]
MLSKSDLTHSVLLREHDQYAGRSLKVNGPVCRGTYITFRLCLCNVTERATLNSTQFFGCCSDVGRIIVT